MSTTSSSLTSRWAAPALCLLLAGVFFAAFAINDKPEDGVTSAAVMLVYGAFLAVGGRSQFVRMLRGQHEDERTTAIEQRAGLFAGYVLLAAVLVGFLQSIVRDLDPMPYAALGAVSGVAYLVGLAWLRWRS